jgi:hypothetical protein
VGHHQEANGLQAEASCDAEVLDSDVGLRAVRCDADDLDAKGRGRPDVVRDS